MNNLATVRWDLGDLEGAHDLFAESLSGLQRVLGDHHPDTLTSMNNLAAVRRELDEL